MDQGSASKLPRAIDWPIKTKVHIMPMTSLPTVMTPKTIADSVRNLLHRNSETILPAHSSDKSLADKFSLCFFDKISKIRDTFPTSDSATDAPNLPPPAVNCL